MPKNKKPVARKSALSPEQKDEALTRQLSALAIYLANQPPANATTRDNAAELQKIVKRTLHQKKDDILYEALEATRHDAGQAHRFLKQSIEEAAEVVVIAREEETAVEVNAFVIPLFLHSTGGLKAEQSFQDQQAFEALTASIQDAGLESRAATVVLVNHAYGLDEIDGITYSHLHEMVRDAHAAMSHQKSASASAIERSFGEAADEPFEPTDVAVELRFLLGFTQREVDDPFYVVPDVEAGMEAYFGARELRFQAWAEQVTPLVVRCFSTEAREIEVHFLYQDLFHGGKERGISEYFTLQMMSELNAGLAQGATEITQVRARLAPLRIDGELVVRVNLHHVDDGRLVASADKPLPVTVDIEDELRDLIDALEMMGVTTIDSASTVESDTATTMLH
ncbi:MAG: hypothetical protein M3N23_04410 [Pseudomonadota bacterium]|nr:hypothetical protein [Pseudomonadota bacterium]